MGTAYVYAPNSGQNFGQNCYCTKTVLCSDGVRRSCLNNLAGSCTPTCGTGCNCNAGNTSCPHATTGGADGWVNPIDIGGSASQNINFYATSGIQSIRTQRTSCVCGGTGTWSKCVYVSLYSNASGTTYIGGVMYAHLDDATRIIDGFYQQNLWGKKIGQMTSTNCNCACYGGIHVHMQRRQGSTYSLYSCNTQLYAGSSPLYTFNY
jgi:hypothetical protein